ncbi:heme o synthase [Alishewanella sp. 16-MA]|uniref:Protoheme IX farnesyltransferase n=1 Tax=Alishewanella maricola TaxID=2795740 RepID=A0ABS8C4L7_9ALTE|nr:MULTISPECIES: heme o synthase [Alishewanella]MDP4945621.1 heme o synthase [Alishewanella sp.]MDP5205538.1 heme o synthase [Alishewanella sp. SMS9]MCB5227271.1 heme o synthase [Alishewanella maricola]MDP5034980.1 heme o synthase [Alishewanella sp.]MDP5186916.1 heme o synthase [Alishewanella sp.]
MATLLLSGMHSRLWRDYLELTKPKVVALLVLTAWVGMVLATDQWISFGLLFSATVGIGLLSAAAAALNHVVDQRIDAQMARTHSRPVARGRVSSKQAVIFACSLALAGFVLLYFAVNPLTAWLTLLSLFGYAVVYTMFLKRATPQNIVIGGLAGAMPPLLGWAAVTGDIHGHALLLVMIIFAWTPPHFWALAIHRRDDYAKVNMPMLPVTHGIEYTKSAILLYTLILCIVCLLPYIVGMTGAIYLVASTLLNLRFLQYAWKLKFFAEASTAMATFKFSIVHLMLLFLVLVVDHYFKVLTLYVS